MDDQTFSDACLYGSERWAAMRLGLSVSQFRRRRDRLDREGFPRRDDLTGGWLKRDVDAWVAKRAQIDVQDGATMVLPIANKEVRYGKL